MQQTLIAGRSTTRLPERNLDLLRACAVLSVWGSHMWQTLAHTYEDHGLGRVGVLAFFLHTALVLMGSIERSGVDSAGWVRRFYLRRIARIYPLLWFTIALCLLLGLPFSNLRPPAVPTEVAHAWGTVWPNALLVQNLAQAPNVLSVFWTLPLEVQMYVLLPLCYLVAVRWGARSIVVGIAAAAVFVFFVPFLPPGVQRFSVTAYVPCFLAGVLAYSNLRTYAARLPAPSWYVVLPAWWLLALLIPVRLLPLHWVACVLLAIAVAATHELHASAVTRCAGIVAKYSYGIYLLHVPAWSIAFDKIGNGPAAVHWIVYALLVIGLPVAAYHLVESPAIEWMRRRTARLSAAVPSRPSVLLGPSG